MTSREKEFETDCGERRMMPARRPGAAMFLLSLIMALVLPAQAHEVQPLPQALKPVAEAARREAAKLQDFATGPRYIEFAAPNGSCAQIYEEMVRLMPRTYNYKPDFYDDPRNAALGMLGFVFTPVFYGWAYTALDNYSEDSSISRTNMRLNSLRQAAAQQDCWVRQ
jgi:hypothetical protein